MSEKKRKIAVSKSAKKQKTVDGWLVKARETQAKPQASPKDCQDYMIRGVNIQFPFKAYGSQKVLMDKILKCILKGENGLLESPTGTGKTLSLLVPALAWLKNERLAVSPKATNGDEEDFVANPVPLPEIGKKSLKNEKIPKIYIASRTQSQIKQMVNELKVKTVYTPKMAILGSRKHYCINQTALKSSNINESCEELVGSNKCRFYNNFKSVIGHTSLSGTENQIWDIEDLVTLGKKVRGCPYYASRSLTDSADVVFTPYNYLIDPVIRKSVDIMVEDSIIIIDEAHNIEGVATEAASIEITEKQLVDTYCNLSNLIESGYNVQETMTLRMAVKSIEMWLVEQKDDNFPEQDYNQSFRIYSGQDAVRKFEAKGILPANLDALSSNLNTITTKDKSEKAKDRDVNLLSTTSLKVLRSIIMILEFLFSNYTADFKMVVTKKRPGNNNTDQRELLSVGFWCLNPAVIFKELEKSARCIILTSGTLSPLSSFGQELGVKFENSFEANHIVKDNQVWVGAISAGPNGKALLGNFKTFESFEYQDQLGLSIEDLCRVIPSGVLVFLPSYNLMTKLIKRWNETGLHTKLSKIKQIFVEPRGADSEFDQLIVKYQNSAKQGALLFCIYRGKMSEGIDFAAHLARAVICVGIPYPNVKDPRIAQKREYNNAFHSSRQILSGTEWFETQAFRALNQAMGRCIRNKNDWGAIILLDQRFYSSDKCISSLSKWIKIKAQKYASVNTAVSSLDEFYHSIQNEESLLETPRNTRVSHFSSTYSPEEIHLMESPQPVKDTMTEISEIESKIILKREVALSNEIMDLAEFRDVPQINEFNKVTEADYTPEPLSSKSTMLRCCDIELGEFQVFETNANLAYPESLGFSLLVSSSVKITQSLVKKSITCENIQLDAHYCPMDKLIYEHFMCPTCLNVICLQIIASSNASDNKIGQMVLRSPEEAETDTPSKILSKYELDFLNGAALFQEGDVLLDSPRKFIR